MKNESKESCNSGVTFNPTPTQSELDSSNSVRSLFTACYPALLAYCEEEPRCSSNDAAICVSDLVHHLSSYTGSFGAFDFEEWAKAYLHVSRRFVPLVRICELSMYEGAYRVIRDCGDLGLGVEDAQDAVSRTKLWLLMHLDTYYESPTTAADTSRLFGRARFEALAIKKRALARRAREVHIGNIDDLGSDRDGQVFLGASVCEHPHVC